ncbi:DEAD/DEAH box helicase family protein [Candidatus Pacearchaeota archaeon]|nr:DEAD/DEAH box helicase family protein [Candidatus Pacearchaeota archaeon]
MGEIIINETFDDDNDDFLFDKIEKSEFESSDVLDLKLVANEFSKDDSITKLLCHRSVQKNLEYELPHQSDGALQILRDFNCNALLADEVGLGKTITTGMIIRECIERGFVNNIIILTPPSLVDQWVSELKEKFELDFTIIEKKEDWNNNFVVASLDRVKIFNRKKNEFNHGEAHERSWDLLIVDEAHKLKERNTLRWRFVDQIQKKRFLMLTATPFQNDLLELYNLLHLLKRGHLGTVKEFRKQFISGGNKRRPLNPRDLKRKLDEVMVRRRRADTVVAYMKRIPKIIAVEPTKEEQDIYAMICEMLKEKYFLANGNEINGKLAIYSILPKITSSSRSAMESLQKIISNDKYHEKTKEIAEEILEKYIDLKKDSKIEKLFEIVAGIYEKSRDNKILIYTKHPTTLRYIVEKLKPLNLNIVEFMGGMDREGKTEIIRQFKEEADILISTETGAEGLNFQFCNNLINFDLPWNPMTVEQRIGRLDRIGQKRDMNIFSLATKGTMEEYVVDLIINKMCCIGLVIGELPIILFNLGLDGNGKMGKNKIEEMLMEKFLDSRNNLDIFSKSVEAIAEIIDEGIESYNDTKEYSEEILEEKNG